MNIRGAEMVPGGEVEKKEVKMSNTALLSLHAHPLLSFLNPLLKSQKKKKPTELWTLHATWLHKTHPLPQLFVGTIRTPLPEARRERKTEVVLKR